MTTAQTELRPQGLLLRFKQHWQILCLAFIVFTLHLIVLNYSASYVGDEGHYVPQAVTIVQERGPQVLAADPTFLDHPALAKLFIAGGIAAFGDNPWGWRIPSVVFGVASIVIFYFILMRLAGKTAALLASFLFAFENFSFALAGVAMLDVFSVTFMLSSFLCFLDKRYVLSGTALALAGICKLPGLFGILVILGYWVWDKKRADIRKIGLLLVSLVVIFLFLMPIVDFAATNQWFNPVNRVHDMLVEAQSHKYHGYTPEVRAQTQSAYPWEWILSDGPLWFTWGIPGAQAISFQYTPMFFFLIVPSVLHMAYQAIRKAERWAVFGLLWFCATYVVWIPIVLVTDRATYQFYFLPTVGTVCMAIGSGIQRIWRMSNGSRETHTRWLLRGLVVSCLAFYVASFLLHAVF